MRKDKAGSEVSLIFEFKIIDRISSTITPPYEAIGQAARSSEVNHINETS